MHATAVAVLGTYDPTCDNSWKDCDAQGAVVRVDITFPGRYYTSAPVVKFKPKTPKVVVTPNERALDFKDPAQVGYYSQQGKGWDELDPEQPHGSWTNGAEDTSVGYDVTDPPNGQNRMPGVSAHQTCVTTGFCPEARNPEDRGPLLPPLGKAWMDGSIKPGHQELVRVSNNYHKFGAMRGNDQSQVRTHFGYRNHTKNASIGEDLGYWMWSESGMTEAEMNRCRVSNNPPIHQFSSLQGHGLDAALGLGTADDEFQLIGPTNNLRYLDGSSVGGADPMFFQFKAAAEFDSWLSVGITQGDSGGKIGTVGMKFDAWTAATALSVSDGAIFWMNPDSGPGHSAPKALGSKCCVGDAIVLAQLTVPKAYHGTATMNGTRVPASKFVCLPQILCSPNAQPWSPASATTVSPATACSSSASSSRPTWWSVHETAA